MVAVGDLAPDFTLTNQHREPVALSSYRGQPVVVVFFAMAFTGVCAGELRALGTEPDGIAVLAVSCDNVPSLRVFADQEGLEYPLLSDFWPHGDTARAYGVFDETSGVALRGTFVIDADGRVVWRVVNAIPDARDHTELRSVLAGLG